MSAPVSTQPVSAPVAPTVANNATVETAPSKPHIEKMKINGKEVEVSLDELKNAYGLHMTATSRFEEASRLRKEAEQVKEVFSKKDVSTLLKAGWTEDEIEQKAAEYLVNKQLEKNLTPEQKAQRLREEEYKRLKQAEEDKIRTDKEKIENELRQKEAKLYQTAFMSDLAKEDNKTWLDLNDPVLLTHIINDITMAINDHGYDMSVNEAVQRLEKRMEKSSPTKKDYLKKLLKHTITDLDESDLEAFLEKGGKGVREKSSEIFKKSTAFDKKQTIPQTPSEEPKKPVKDAKWHREMRNRGLSKW